uniref:Sodium/hydrogen exchanger n=1 Tax=Rhizophora mucronata TaxID=61149 RepID=A0A2P2KLE2_RHIMU
MAKDIKVPTAPNNTIVIKFRKNCFFFTWNPALNMIGGRRYMKKSSSLNNNMRELLHPVLNRIIIPVKRPMARAVIDSLTQRFFSRS